MSYNELVKTCFFHPKHVGTIDLKQPHTAHYRSGLPGQGDLYDLYLRFDETGLIKEARFRAFGNPWLIAALELVCQALEGSQIDEHPKLDYAWLAQKLEIPKMRFAIALQVEDGYRELVRECRSC